MKWHRGLFQKGNKIGHRFPKGHHGYPRRIKHPLRYKRLAAEVVSTLSEEYGPDVSAKQLIHIKNIADIEAEIQEMKDERALGHRFDRIQHATLVNTQRKEFSEL
jgi:hypothetical protein